MLFLKENKELSMMIHACSQLCGRQRSGRLQLKDSLAKI
jgi:hypothetical protein